MWYVVDEPITQKPEAKDIVTGSRLTTLPRIGAFV
jgi:hypothetical protein